MPSLTPHRDFTFFTPYFLLHLFIATLDLSAFFFLFPLRFGQRRTFASLVDFECRKSCKLCSTDTRSLNPALLKYKHLRFVPYSRRILAQYTSVQSCVRKKRRLDREERKHFVVNIAKNRRHKDAHAYWCIWIPNAHRSKSTRRPEKIPISNPGNSSFYKFPFSYEP